MAMREAVTTERPSPSRNRHTLDQEEEEAEEIVSDNEHDEEVDEENASVTTPRCVPRRPRRTTHQASTRQRVQRVVQLTGPGRTHVRGASAQGKAAFMTHLPDSPPRSRPSIFQFADARLKTPTKAAKDRQAVVIAVRSGEEEEEDDAETAEDNEEEENAAAANECPEVDESQEKLLVDDDDTSAESYEGPRTLDLSLPQPISTESPEDDDTSSPSSASSSSEDDDDDEKDEEEYQHLQEAHARFEAEQTERDTLRLELESYVASLTAKRDDNGEQLIEFPRNFQQIVSLMTAQDIASDATATPSSDHKSWSHVLIQNSLAKQQAFGALDDGEDATDGEGSLATKIALKMARIRQLDAVLEEKLGKNLYAPSTVTLKKTKRVVNPQEPDVVAVRTVPPSDASTTSPSAMATLNYIERNRQIVENGAKANLTRAEEHRVKRLLREARKVEGEETPEAPAVVAQFKLDQQEQEAIEKLIADMRGVYPSAVIMALDDIPEDDDPVDEPVATKKDQRKANILQDSKRERQRRQRLQRIEEELKFLHDNETVPILPDDDDDPSDGASSERSFMTTTSMLSTASTRSGVTRRQLDQFVAAEVTKANSDKASRDEIQQLLRSLSHLPLPTSRPGTTASV